ncbi:MAG: cell wall-binding repeat-containing protein [Desulfitobacterium sp.]
MRGIKEIGSDQNIQKLLRDLILLAIFFLPLIPSSVLAASSPTVQYVGGSDWEVFNDVDQTRDGGYVVVGHSSSNNGHLEGLNKKQSDAVIVKFSAAAEVQWLKTFGGSSIDSFQSVRQTRDGGYIAAGSSYSVDMDMDNSNKRIREGEQDELNGDAIIVKFSPIGEVEWSKDFGGGQLDGFNAVVETETGSFLVVGESESVDGDLVKLSQGKSDAIYASYDQAGTFLGAQSYGGSSGDGFNDLALLTDGSFVAVGYSSSHDGDLQGTGTSLLKGIIVKISDDLRMTWKTSVDLTDPEYQRLIYSSSNGFQDIKTTTDRGFIVVGKGANVDLKTDGNGIINEDGWIGKFDSKGQVEWYDTYKNQAYTRFSGVAQDQDGTYMVVGDSYMPAAKKIIALRYDARGVRLWEKEDGGSRNRCLMSLLALGDRFAAVGSKYIQGRSDEGLLYIGNFEDSNEKLIMDPNTRSSTTESSSQIQSKDRERLGGDTRYETATAISKRGWEKAEQVFLVDANNFPDALVGSSLAYQKNAPILITPTERLDPNTSAEIQRLGARTITILGNYTSVSRAVEEQLKQNYQVIRISGAEVFDTAVKVGEELRKATPFDTVIIATQDNFPDTLAIAPYAAKESFPILFTHRDSLRADTKQAIKDWGIENVIISGGLGVVSMAVDLELDALGVTINRLGGDDRYDTALEIAKHFRTGSPYKAISVATGENYPDALTGAVFAAKNNTPLILVRVNGAKENVIVYLNALSLDKAFIFGGLGVVSDHVIRE